MEEGRHTSVVFPTGATKHPSYFYGSRSSIMSCSNCMVQFKERYKVDLIVRLSSPKLYGIKGSLRIAALFIS